MFKRISLKVKIVTIIIILIFVFPQKMYASYIQDSGELRYYYLEFQEDGERWQSKSVICGNPASSLEEKVFHLFEDFFGEGLAPSVPTGTKVLQVTITNGLLVLNVSHEIKNYGGTANEAVLIRQIVETAQGIPGIDKVTMLIEGEEDYLPEGSRIYCKNTMSST